MMQPRMDSLWPCSFNNMRDIIRKTLVFVTVVQMLKMLHVMEKLCNQQKLHILLMVTNNWDLCHVSVKATGSHVFLQSPRLAMASSNTANSAWWTHISVISWNNSSHGGKQFQFSAGAWGNVLLWVKSGHHGADGSCPPDTQRMYDCLTRHHLPPRRATALRSPPPKTKNLSESCTQCFPLQPLMFS